MFSNILVLCTGNICRSPIAEAVLRERLPPLEERTVASAGTAALVAEPAEPLAIEVAGEHGLDLSGHRARQATAPLLEAADLVLVMERAHADWVHAKLPAMRGRVHLLGRWREAEIADPYGKPKPAFDIAWARIEEAVSDWVPRLG